MTNVNRRGEQTRGAIYGLSAAVLFGMSAPLAKVLLGTTPPILLAGLLYLGAAIGLWTYRLLQRQSKEAPLIRSDMWKLSVVVLTGGIVGPVLMLLGLQRVTSLTGSLVLNLEAPLTVVLAVLLFGEHLGKYALAAVAFILGGAFVLRLESGFLGGDASGVALLAMACLCWAVDNNVTQRLSLKDPFAIVRVKTLVSGTTNTVLGLMITHGELPQGRYLAAALVLGGLSYGASVVLDAYALRFVGAAREAAYFATAPFVGVLISVLLLGDTFGWTDALAMSLMAMGVVFLLRERHAHVHQHEALEHEHLHAHDAHHQHTHGPDDPTVTPHSHRHRHQPLVHDHPHTPDAHHRHRH